MTIYYIVACICNCKFAQLFHQKDDSIVLVLTGPYPLP